MTGNWEAELRKIKRQYIEETIKKHKGLRVIYSRKSEFRNIMKLIKSLLLPVVEVFRGEELAKTLQPHIHEYKTGYTLVVPVAEPEIKPIILKLEFELLPTEEGHILKVIRETPKKIPALERIIESPITEEKIRNEIRAFLSERQSIILNSKKRIN